MAELSVSSTSPNKVGNGKRNLTDNMAIVSNSRIENGTLSLIIEKNYTPKSKNPEIHLRYLIGYVLTLLIGSFHYGSSTQEFRL